MKSVGALRKNNSRSNANGMNSEVKSSKKTTTTGAKSVAAAAIPVSQSHALMDLKRSINRNSPTLIYQSGQAIMTISKYFAQLMICN
ncbi:MAG: hypothetical protein WCC66_08185 [Rhizobiaceae bacterium]